MKIFLKISANRKFFLLLLFAVFLLNLIIFLFANTDFDEIDCSNYLVVEIDKFEIDNYFQNNPYSIKNNIGLIELDIFPDINSLKCVGTAIKSDILSNNFDYLSATSQAAYKAFSFAYVYFLLNVFLLFKEKSKFLFLFFLIKNYYVISYLFLPKNLLNFQVFIYLFGYVLFIYSSADNLKDFYFELVFNLSLFLLLFNYDIYSKFQIFLIFLYFKVFRNISLTKNHLKLLTLTPIIYYFMRQVSGSTMVLGEIWENLSSGMYRGPARFADMFYTYGVIYCNKNGCDTTNNYGPLFELLAFDLNIEILTISTSILLIFITQIYYFNFINKLEKDHFLAFLLYTCGPFTFLVERMNFDIVVVILGYFALHIYAKNYKLYSLVILSLLTLVKIFPIFFIIGILIHELKYKNKKEARINFSIIVLLAILYVVYYLADIQSGFTPNPYGITWTFGVLSDFQNYKGFTNSFIFLIYIFIIVFCIFIFIKYIDYKNPLSLDSKNQLIEFSFLLTFLPVALYYNFDYRLGILIIPTILILKNYRQKYFTLTSSIFLFTSVSNFLPVENITENVFAFIFSISFVAINHLSFYLLFFQISQILIQYLNISKLSSQR